MNNDEIGKALANPNTIVTTTNDRTRNNDTRQGSGRETGGTLTTVQTHQDSKEKLRAYQP